MKEVLTMTGFLIHGYSLDPRKQSNNMIALHGRCDHGAVRRRIAPPNLRSDLQHQETISYFPGTRYTLLGTVGFAMHMCGSRGA